MALNFDGQNAKRLLFSVKCFKKSAPILFFTERTSQIDSFKHTYAEYSANGEGKSRKFSNNYLG